MSTLQSLSVFLFAFLRNFQVHRVVLASCSDYFRAMFSHDMLESKASQLDLSAVPSQGFEPLLDFAYSGKLKLNLLNIGDVLATSSFLQVSLFNQNVQMTFV